jgi:hypothetical protein
VTVSPTITATDTTTILPVWPVKAGARNSAADLERLQDLHDLAVELGAACATADHQPSDTDAVTRAATPEEPSEAKGQEPPVRNPLVLLAEIELLEAALR